MKNNTTHSCFKRRVSGKISKKELIRFMVNSMGDSLLFISLFSVFTFK
ncbi:MAG: hypothetical protein GY729_20980 [Desulfobacteraceae bacterium]|nr:hypothetical protein [Desulfobacteraceae bacterium]